MSDNYKGFLDKYPRAKKFMEEHPEMDIDTACLFVEKLLEDAGCGQKCNQMK